MSITAGSAILAADFPAALTLIPRPVKIEAENSNNVLYSSLSLSTNTEMWVGLVQVQTQMTVNKVSIYVSAVGAAGTCKIALFSEDGQTKIFEVTTASISSTGVKTTAVSAVTIPRGNYYVAIVSVSTTNINPVVWVGDNSLLDVVTSEPVLDGTVTVTAGTVPSTITPGSITSSTTHTLYFRLDN